MPWRTASTSPASRRWSSPPGALEHAAGRFHEGFAYVPDPAELDTFDSSFPVKEKAITDFQREFQVMCSLGHEVIPHGFMQ